MNSWMNEVMAEKRRGELLAQMESIRMERQAHPRRPMQNGVYGRSMLRLADWMIAAGRDLRCRYALPAVDCSRRTVTGGGLAR
jgi:hypothetical protein